MKNNKDELPDRIKESLRVSVYLLGVSIIKNHGKEPDERDSDFIEFIAHREKMVKFLTQDGIDAARKYIIEM